MPPSSVRRTSPTPWRSLCLLGFVATILAVGALGMRSDPVGAVPLPNGTSFGVNVKIWYLHGRYQPSNLSTGYASGLSTVRTEAIQGQNMDGIVTWLAQSRMRLYPILGLPCPPGTRNCNAQTQIPPDTAASEMASYITAFAQRYGPGGSFWSENPYLPYLPVQRFEIGNEPNLRVYWVQDGTHLHWDQPAHPLIADYTQYAKVYKASRNALHTVDPSGIAVVGGLADSASYGIDVQSDEAALLKLRAGGVDAVGYHPWVFDVSNSLLQSDTTELRTWMNANGFSGVPLDINEFGACQTTSHTVDNHYCNVSQDSATWGAAVASYTRWAVCSPWVNVGNIQPFVWGATPVTDQDVWLPLFAGNGTETPYGQDFLTQASSLTNGDCPPPPPAPPAPVPAPRDSPPRNTTPPLIEGAPVSGTELTGNLGEWSGKPLPSLSAQWLRCDSHGSSCSAIADANSSRYTLQSADVGSTIALLVTATSSAGGATATSAPSGRVIAAGSTRSLASMALRIVRLTTRNHRLRLTVREARGAGAITVTVVRPHRKQHPRRLRGRLRSATTTAFSMRLAAGRWILTVTGTPTAGFAKPRPIRRKVTIKR